MTALRSRRKPRRPMPPWVTAEHVAGVLLGLAIAAMAIDHGMRHPTNTLPPTPTPTVYPGP